MIIEFSLKLFHHAWVKFMEFTFLENAMIRRILSCPSLLRTRPQLTVSRPRQKEVTHSPRKHLFKNLFSPTAEKGGGNCDLLYQNLVRKC